MMRNDPSVSPLRILILALALSALVTLPAVGQPSWSWPERAEDLRVLPEDLPPQRLRAVMTGFSRALGVRCSHCHVGEEGAPLASHDFVSDDNPNKERAREMLRMLGSINEHLEKIEPSGLERVNMWCHTCHRGAPRPATLEEELAEAYAKGGAEAALERYGELRERYLQRGTYDFGEGSLNAFGYGLLQDGDADGAVAVFRLNAEHFPSSANARDSLAEAYLAAGEPELAEVFYRKSLELDPGNRKAVEKLRELRLRWGVRQQESGEAGEGSTKDGAPGKG